MTERWIDLGLEASFGTLPAQLSVGTAGYHLIRCADGYRLLSTVCPHQGGTVNAVPAGFECPNHAWSFDYQGRCINAPELPLESFPVSAQDGHLYAQVPEQSTEQPRTPKTLNPMVDCTIQLHSHACVEFNYKGFSLLADPWLVGPAFLGAWIQYPPSSVDISKLKPNAIVISHEHSDHFHEPTLELLDHTIPVYVPDFPNRRMVERLAELGFSDVHPMAFGETYELSDDMKLTCYEPGSLWNDSIILIEIGAFRFLNLNDAGLNQRIAALVAPVNVVASGFSPGASGYPLTWGHLSDTKKIEIQNKARQGSIELLKEALHLYGGEYLLPMACHFALWHPSHIGYSRLSRRNSVIDIVNAFDQDDVRVIDLLPGETWDVSTGDIQRCWEHREELYDRDTFLTRLPGIFDQTVFESHHPASVCPSRDEVEDYLLSLNNVPDIIFCDDMNAVLRVREIGLDRHDSEVAFEIIDARLSILPESPNTPNLVIELPGGILKRIVAENLSWDEAHIGYWCRFSRSPDIYHAGFWRLLQAPYFNKPTYVSELSRKPFAGEAIIGDLVEEYGDRANRVLRRYGLYCTGCQHSAWCSVSDSARVHGVPDAKVDRLTKELRLL